MDLKGLASMIGGMVDTDTAIDRMEICNDCEHLTSFTTCRKCGCFMKTKVKFKKASCPIDKWGKSE